MALLRVALVDPDQTARARLSRALVGTGEISGIAASSSEEGLEIVRREPIDALLVASTLDGSAIDARMLCRLLRRHGSDAVIVILARRASMADEILALEAGANDFLVLPVSTEVLLARLRAHLRHSRRNAAPADAYGVDAASA
jgi:DNA-binding response OmpR family regulator